jgi:hypothetical protein
VSKKITSIKRCNYELITHFTLPNNDWWKGYYEILSRRIAEYNQKTLSAEEKEILTTTEVEIAMFKKYSDQYGYEFFIMQKM